MPATNPRVSAVLDPELATWLHRRAAAENRSVSTLVREILARFYAEEEERHWASEGEARLATFTEVSAIAHEDAWSE
jgi:hypothetical protein